MLKESSSCPICGCSMRQKKDTIVNGYTIKLAKQSGGKAGKGYNKTSTIQVMDDNNCIKKAFRYNIGSSESYYTAYDKAVHYAKGKPKQTV